MPQKKPTLAQKFSALKGKVEEWDGNLHKFITTCANEFGKVWTNQQEFARSIDHVDKNVLALSKLVEKLFQEAGHSEEDYEEAMKAAFDEVFEEEEAREKEAEESEEAQTGELTEEDAELDSKIHNSADIDPERRGGGDVPAEAVVFGD